MMNYCLTKEEEETFILNYVEEKNTITIFYANGQKETKPYSKELEKQILNQMKSQVGNAEKLLRNCKEYIEVSISSMKFNSYASFLFFILAISFMFLNFSVMEIISLFLSIGTLGKSLIDRKKRNKSKQILEDIEKQKMLIEKEKELKSHEKEEKLLVGVPRIKREALEYIPSEKTVYNLHTADLLSYEDVKQILENLKEILKENNFQEKMTLNRMKSQE